MSELKRGFSTSSVTGNGWSKNADEARRDALVVDGSHEHAAADARRAVAEYLRDVGLCDPDLIARQSREVVSHAQQHLAPTSSITSLTEAAIRLTVKQLDRWLMGLAAGCSDTDGDRRLGSVIGSRLPDLLNRYPQAWKRSRLSEEVVESAREKLTPVVPEVRHREMRPQDLALMPSSFKRWRARMAKLIRGNPPADQHETPTQRPTQSTRAALSRRRTTRMILALLTALTALLGTWMFCNVAARDGLGLLGIALAMLFAILLTWVAFSFWVATLGLIVQLRRGALREEQPSEAADLPPTALVMPIHNESPRNIFANVRAMIQSLHTTGKQAAFDFFVLSDTTDATTWLEEERAWAQLVAKLPLSCHVFYRHRWHNDQRKAGNIADFCRRWGDHYRYMIVLDADSLMAGATLVEMVRRMEQDPRIGILQSPTRPINRQSIFARVQQFAAHMYGPTFLEGFVHWSECDGNYYGHNAIIRIGPFMEHCELPTLSGDGPLGGEILSHDFVEAALMRRADWKVCIAHDLEKSYEECPATILGFAQRDQRWCQGNLQHLRLLLAEGLHPASRLHFGMGAMSFLASPLWLAFLLLTVAGAIYGGKAPANEFHAPGGAALFIITMALLLLPKLWGVISLQRQRTKSQEPRTKLQRALASVGIETLVSMLTSPIMMLMHTHFVISTLLGKRVSWNAQQRDDCRVSLGEAVAVHGWHTLIGVAMGVVAWLWAPGLLPWLSPVLAGLVLSIPLAMVLGSVRIGKALASRGLLMIPEEVTPPPIMKYQQDDLTAKSSNLQIGLKPPDMFTAVFQDPAFYALHMGILRATDGHVPISAQQLAQLKSLIAKDILMTAPAELRRAILRDCQTMESLHVFLRSRVPPSHSVLVS